MKKHLIIAAASALLLVACGDNQGSSTDQDTTGTASGTYDSSRSMSTTNETLTTPGITVTNQGGSSFEGGTNTGAGSSSQGGTGSSSGTESGTGTGSSSGTTPDTTGTSTTTNSPTAPSSQP